MNAHQEIADYRGWPVTHCGPTKTEFLYPASDGAFVLVQLAERLACEIDRLERRVEQLTQANTLLRTIIENQRDRLREMDSVDRRELKDVSTGRGLDFPR